MVFYSCKLVPFLQLDAFPADLNANLIALRFLCTNGFFLKSEFPKKMLRCVKNIKVQWKPDNWLTRIPSDFEPIMCGGAN